MITGKIIKLSTAFFTNENGKFLIARKKNSKVFMMIGGKTEEGEDPLTTLIREIKEEIQIDILSDLPKFSVHLTANAANEAGYTVESNVFRIHLDSSYDVDSIKPSAEIAEIRWVTLEEISKYPIANLLRKYIENYYKP